LTGLSAGEAQALFALLGPAASQAPDAKSALRKLNRALPDTFRADAEAAARAVVVDPAGWGEQDRVRSELIDVLQSAVVRRRKIRLRYRGWDRQPSERLVDPLGLVDKNDVWYLIAGTGKGRRTFRVDRIVQAAVTELVAERPVGFDLTKAWQQVVADVEQQRGLVVATVLIEARFVSVLRAQFGRQCEVEGPVDDGRYRVRLSAPTVLVIAQQLAGWGGLLQVVRPVALRAELGRIGAELVDKYPS
jgi:predicted DNA-binding transcriptional regulator YafY